MQIITTDSQLGQLRSAFDKLTYGAYICKNIRLLDIH